MRLYNSMEAEKNKLKNELIEKQLFWEKYRPQSLEELIVPSRIMRLAENGIQGNYIFYGSSGIGKTTLARILLKDYQNGLSMVLSSKLGIEVLRTKVDKFCREMIPFEDPNKLRVVYFEEFDRASSTLQEELKSFIEDHSHRVRFIATCNNITKIDSAIRSRFMEVSYNPSGEQETKEMKQLFGKRVLNILKNENIELDRKDLVKIINNRFPDFRKCWQDIQMLILTGVNTTETNLTIDESQLFELIFSGKNHIEIFDYLYVNWMDKIDNGFLNFGKMFYKWLEINHPSKLDLLGSHAIILSEYSDLRLPNALDPFTTFYAFVCRLKELYK